MDECFRGDALGEDRERAPVAAARNLLIAALPDQDQRRLMGVGHSIELRPGDILSEPGTLSEHVFFPTGSFISARAQLSRDTRLDVALVGSEGMIGVSLALGVNTCALQSMVRGGGRALRVSAEALRREMARSAALRRGLNRYVCVLLNELAQNAACSRFHRIDERLAKWLLVTRDRAHSDRYHMTHDLLSQVLGVRRVGVTVAATALQRQRLIRYCRGDIEILDAPGLQRAACGCYATSKENYAQLLS